MINTEGFHPMPILSTNPVRGGGQEISRLLGAALINRSFCHLLLNQPLSALKAGFQGHHFKLAPEEVQLILSIQADTLAEFAGRISKAQAYSKIGPAIEPGRNRVSVREPSWAMISEISGTD